MKIFQLPLRHKTVCKIGNSNHCKDRRILHYNTKIHLILAICGKKTQNNEKLGQTDSN